MILRDRVINHFDLGPTKNYGADRDCLSLYIRKIQQEQKNAIQKAN